jgi:hypothetical protein
MCEQRQRGIAKQDCIRVTREAERRGTVRAPGMLRKQRGEYVKSLIIHNGDAMHSFAHDVNSLMIHIVDRMRACGARYGGKRRSMRRSA